ncbi:MAG: ABC transporter substrate-binding protein [Thermomicrobiales bacterium]|nr:ABC transporter substrate-binding protein [Thermomicrobiales bacterium]
MAITRRQFTQLIGVGAVGAAVFKAPAAFAQDGGTLRIAMNTSDIGNLDPHFASGSQDRAIVDMIFNGLVRYVPGKSDEFEADLAEAIPDPVTNDDGTQSWTFTLKSGVKTHATDGADSADLTVDDLLFSFTKAANAETSAYAGNYAGWAFAAGDGENEFVVTVPVPISTSLFLPNVANYSGGYVIPQAAFEAVGAEAFVSHPVGTGPFAFVAHTPQLSVELTAHADFFRGAPQLAGVNVMFQADATARELALQAGDYDVIYGVSESSWAQRLDDLDGFTADVFGVGEVVWLNFNIEHDILKDVKVREAIFKAISRDNYVALSGAPVGEKVFSVVPAFLPGGLSEEDAEAAGVNYQQDIEGAKALLAEAGYPDGFELDMIASEQTAYRTTSEVLQEELRQIGITVNLEVVQHATMHELIRQDRNAITIYIAFRPTADIYLTQFFSTDGGVTNFSKFTVNDLRDQARGELDADAQAELWRQANIEILQNYAGYGLMFQNQVFVRRDEVDYGHELTAVVQLYPGINETTSMG